MLIFLHIPRTAGTTLVRILEREYGRSSVVGLYGSSFGEGVADLAPEQIGRTRVIAGHFYFGVHDELPAPCRYLTFLRDPVDRVVSHYDFVRRQTGHYLYRAASTMSVQDYVRFCGSREPNNDQTRLLAGIAMATSDGSCSPDMLPAAMRNLDSHAAVGLTEAFDASLVVMRRLLGWKRPFYIRQNAGQRRGDHLSDEARQIICAYNELDIELYHYGRARLDREIAEHGDGFARELSIFRRLNGLYGRLDALASAPARRLAARQL